MYKFYLGELALPVAPGKLSIKIKDKNKTFDLLQGGEGIIPLFPGLTEINFDMMLPAQEYGFTYYPEGYKPISYFLQKLEWYKTNRERVPFIVLRSSTVSGKTAFDGAHDTNITVAVMDYEIIEDADKYGFDTVVSLKLKQAPPYGPQTIPKEGAAEPLKEQRTVPLSQTGMSDQQRTYTVESDDALPNIAQRYLGDASRYMDIYNANKDTITDPRDIPRGTRILLPGIEKA